MTDQQQPQRPKRLRAETDLYAPVKRFLQARGLEAKGVHPADLPVFKVLDATMEK